MNNYCGRRVSKGRTVLINKTVVFYCVRFGLRGLKEQYKLRRYPDSQINIVKIDGKDALVYREFQSKTRQGGYQIEARTLLGYLLAFTQGLGLDA